ncbi:hypothetical protein Murru_0762 [Allomuricauda ruestringensis DSM 13258]|uniref:Lipoprotein n=1 Tax=Allomuricauda ruestringensis (strain DSM 13258 / CIP 107369 / LMG 19739 / B1) TaxID=886377 RepID=G2PJQ3_ALLRU|nr:hypothetical protein [Allomuricauda ruestringensis]AEM69811.1 hypothetical protein Murru_0762 [Allomuricauda ruestringensis DSM 13258]
MRNLIALSFLLLTLFACKTKEKDTKEETVTTEKSPTEIGEVHISTQSMEFFVADTIHSGWNTLIYENKSPEVHFVLMDLYPEGITIENTKAELLPPFDDGMRLIMENKMDSAMTAFGKIPEWFQQVKFMGGTGLVSPKHTVKSTVYLEPGRYIMECYVKMFNGEWHTSHGMLKEIIVSKKTTNLNPPIPTASIDISSTNGLILKDSISSGNQIFQTNFIDQKTYENFVGHDVNLVRYDNTASMDSLIQWMNWMNPKGLRTPTPKGFTFLGGMNNLPAGSKGFFEADLVPGNYVLISEVPAADEKKLLYKFAID